LIEITRESVGAPVANCPAFFRRTAMQDVLPLSSFAEGGIAVVVGAGGIGSALANRIAASGRFDGVVLTSRSGDPRGVDGASVRIQSVDLLEEPSIEGLAGYICELDKPLRLVICATGILHSGEDIRPERRLEDISPAHLARVFAVNAFGPLLIAKHLAPLLPRRERSVFAAISARVGSIGDNRLGGWYAYRASKAALNQFLRCVSIELGRRVPAAIVTALHPGTVDTALSSPFQAGVPDKQLFTADHSAARLLEVVDGLGPEDSGGFFAWDGSPIPW
jgi:NAD(P)-dependent dehydrogenase (short-subunit alcohol dehydrogenase family)